ncbi:glycoside hydrolase family 43 protein [Hymenobacter sp. BT186]|uniref:Glycoside hydrolase family 43 protein n=1 Tax=Hymenobacter telluris TaxID=2816474 RepID=A0A939J7E0_9BACT|nr:glycoside hydrolase family 43 protein [Hymenobacter telluris]MBO0356634.1 glycoside hydrolase family 43 protein [Hymenobacter telluris]MBW3372659.1 glycoside hydrolase family 43 protein [Hymenobacter norwichensis]
MKSRFRSHSNFVRLLAYGGLLLVLPGQALAQTPAAPATPGNPDQPVNVTVPTPLPVYGNPIIRDKYTADPAALVVGNTVYLYTGHDNPPPGKEWYFMKQWLCYSSQDMVHWTEHPSPLNVQAFAWAKADAWASQVIARDGKYYWYAAVEHGSIGGKAIGVAVSDSPTGPFKDARGSALVTNDMTTATKISWDDIDPTAYIDEKGQAYLYWGNTVCYWAKLKPNMTELDGPIHPITTLPRFTEAPWLHKRKDWYYLSYATEFPEKIAYAMSRSLEGPWEYKGILNEVAGNSNTNHQSIIEFNKQWYFIYHNGTVNTHGSSFHRSVCIDRLYYNKNGTLKRVQMTTEGLAPQP